MAIFQMLVVDPAKKTKCDDALSLLHAIRGVSRLWTKSARISESDLEITDAQRKLKLRDQADDTALKENPAKPATRAYLVTLDGDHDIIEPLRLPLTEFIKEQRFEHRYIMKDEVSEKIACELYPYLYRIENLLRAYLTRFMTTRFGASWWDLNASDKMKKDVSSHAGNETVFGRPQNIDNKVFLIGFDDLGDIVVKQTSGLLTREELAKRVMQLKEEASEIKALKADLQSNYHKFFKAAFADRDFESKWKKWFYYRNKIAHTNLFVKDDLSDGKALADEITAIITEAEKSKDQPVVTQGEREAIQEQVIAKEERSDALLGQEIGPEPTQAVPTGSSAAEISEQEFLEELQEQQSFYEKKPNGFVGLTRFLRFHLTDLGFDQYTARRMLHRLQGAGKVEVYYVANPYDSTSQTAALRTTSSVAEKAN